MKRLTLVLLIIFALCIPALAQDATPTQPAVDVNVVYACLAVLAVLLIGAGLYGAKLTGLLTKLMSPEDAKALIQSGVQLGLEIALNQASTTEWKLDDKFFEGLGRRQGYEIIKHADGHYEVKLPSATSAPLHKSNTESISTPPTTYTTTPMRITPPPSGPFGG